MKIHIVGALIALLFISACDRFYGPHIRNRLGGDMVITVTYHDGKRFRHVIPHCAGTSLGGINDPAVKPVRLVIRHNAVVIYEFDAQQLAEFLEKESEAGGYAVWSIEEDGVVFETDPSRERGKGCKHGRPIE